MKLTKRWIAPLRVLSLVGATVLAAACHEPFDDERKEGPRATFGDDLYGVLCDRLGADVFQEDLTGDSYQAACHYDRKGNYADEINTSVLPKPKSAKAKAARRIAVAKMNAMIRRRGDLVRAFNIAFPDVDIDNVATKKQNDTVNLLDALLDFSQKLSALYEKDPYSAAVGDPFAEPLAPAATRSMGRVFGSVSDSDAATEMLTRMWGRRGYRPSHVGLGAMRSMLDYPELRDFTTNAAALLGPGGTATPELQALLRAAEQEMLHFSPEVSLLPGLTVNGPIAQPNRPRTTIEMMREMMLTENERFAQIPGEAPRFIAIRDTRGYVLPQSLSAFADVDSDGRADVDGFGRFIDAGGNPLAIDPPFAIAGQTPLGALDPFGRPSDGGLYRYVDTARTPAAGLGSLLVPLLDATEYADPKDPEAFKSEYETFMYALAGAYQLMGPREEAEYDFEADQRVPLGTGCKSCLKYSRFVGEQSPLVDLAYGLGQVLADPESDVMLLATIDLLENHEDKLARLLSAAMRVREISNDHDELAAAGQIEPALLAYENPIWDQAAQIVSQMTDQPRLLSNVLSATADPVIASPIAGSAHMGDTVGLFASMRDKLDYDHQNVNGSARNLTVGGFSTSDPITPVDWNAPRSGDNRSVLEQSLLLIHDTRGAKTCNKNGAVVKARLLGLTVDWPLTGSYTECELFEIPDLAAFYFGAVLHPTHPKRAVFTLKSNALNGIMSALGFISSADEMFEESSGLTGMTTHPTPAALNRLVYFGAASGKYPSMPDFDTTNAAGRTDRFISSLMEPAPTSVCPVNGFGVANCVQDDLLRTRTGQSIFSWERRGFLTYLAPVVTAFANVSCSPDVSICTLGDFTGERMFLDLANVIYSHYPGADHGPECDSNGTYDTNPRFCSGAGVNRYEPIIEKAGRTDLVPALQEFSAALKDVSRITIQRGPKAGQTLTGTEAMEVVVRLLFSQSRANQQGMTKRNGDPNTTWTDGTLQFQVTPFNLLADGLHGMDVAFDQAGEDGALRKAHWRRARSQLVDSLLATEGSGSQTRFANRALAPMLVTTLKLFREQLNAHCPDRENGGGCQWAKRDMADNMAEALSSPLFAGMLDLAEAMRQDSKGRRSLERFLAYLLQNAGSGEALQGTLASMVDGLQVMTDDEKLAPLMKAMAVALKPHDDPDGAGAADTTLRVLKALSSDEYDRYHVLDHVLKNLVAPVPDENGLPGLSPLEIFIEVITEVHRADPDFVGEPLDPTDYHFIMRVMRDFMLDQSRGLEQVYTIVKRRRRP